MTEAPLSRIVETRPGPPLVLKQDDFSISLRTVVHTLECGHTTEPYVRDGCRLPKLPKRRRCRQCLHERRLMETNWLNIARFAYEAYAETTGNKNCRGEEMPAFDELPEKIREAWVNAVKMACDVFGRAVTA